VHVSTGAGVALVAEARGRGVDATCETCPHYLVLTEDDLERLGTAAKCASPLRSAEEREALWAQLGRARIELVASDHSPAPFSMKAGDFGSAWGGIAGCQSLLGLLLDEGHHRRGVPLGVLAALTSEQPAKRFRLPGKGRLAPGADADLALVDLGAEHVLAREDLHDRHRLSPYAGRTLRGRVVRTLVRGVTVFRDGRTLERPHGRLLRPTRGDTA